jgi:hypothetical protein
MKLQKARTKAVTIKKAKASLAKSEAAWKKPGFTSAAATRRCVAFEKAKNIFLTAALNEKASSTEKRKLDNLARHASGQTVAALPAYMRI